MKRMCFSLSVYHAVWLLVCLGVALMSGAPAHAATFNVNQVTDAIDADPLDGICDSDLATPGRQCTLRAAVMQANALAGMDKINLKSKFYALTIPPGVGVDEEEGDLDIDLSVVNANSLIIKGKGRGTIISAGGLGDRVFEVIGSGMAGETLLLNKLTITGGSDVDYGGGIYNVSGRVALKEVSVVGNSALNGGGIHNRNGSMLMNRSTVANNSAVFEGGGITNVFASSSTWLNNVTIANNSAEQGGSGIFAATLSTTNLYNVTLTQNSSLTNSAALRVLGSTVNVSNSIIAGQVSGDDCDLGTVISAGYNLESGTSCGLLAVGDQQNVAALNLEPTLGNYGGKTDTVPPRWDSPAIDAADPLGCFGDKNANGVLDLLVKDQRRFARVDFVTIGNSPPDAVCDVGAAELNDLVINGTMTELSQKFAPHWILDNASLGDHGNWLAHVVADGAPEKMYQEIVAPVNGLAGDQYFFQMQMASLNTTSTYMDAGVEYRDLGGVTHFISIPLNDGTHGVETYSINVVIPMDYDLLTVVALSTDMSGDYVAIDNVQLLIQ